VVFAKERSRRRWVRSTSFVGYLLVAPAIGSLLIIIAYPLVLSIIMSFSDKTIGNPGKFVGLGNFKYLLQLPVFRIALTNSLLYTAVTVALKLVLGLVFALLLYNLPKTRQFLVALALMPWFVPTSLTALMWWWMFNPLFGVFNRLLQNVGVAGIPWLSQPFWAKIAVMAVNIWRGIPFFATCFLAGLLAIPRDYYEAAMIDGAGSFMRFWKITLPLLKTTIGVVVLYSIIMTVADFEIVWLITKGGPQEATHLLGTLAYTVGLMSGRLGEGAATSLFLLPLLLLCSIWWLRSIRRSIRYEL